MGTIKQDAMPVIRDLRDFDQHSGNLLERLVFNFRPLFMLLMALAFWMYAIAVALARVRTLMLERERNAEWVRKMLSEENA